MVSTPDNFRFLSSIDEISPKEWNACAGIEHPFTRYEFFYALEKSKSAISSTGWKPFHYIETNTKGDLIAICPLYIKSHSFGEYIFDHAWAEAYRRNGLRYYPKIQSSVPFTPVTGKRIMIKKNIPNHEFIEKRVIENIITEASKIDVSSVHFNFLNNPNTAFLKKNNLMLRKGIQFHWQNNNYSNFNDFLSTLSSRKRKLINKERICLTENNVRVELLTGSQITKFHWDFFYKCYLNTTESKWGSSYLTKDFFYMIGKNLSSKILLVLALQNERYIASALNFMSNTHLYGRLWGCTSYIPFLHFELCYYQAIDYAIKNKIKIVEAGAQGSHKLQRGYIPKETFSIHWIKDFNFKGAIQNYLDDEIKIIEKQKKDLEHFTPFRKN
jgi:hypothetical protein